MVETWRPIPGYEFYEASDQGRVRSVDRTVASRWGTPRLMSGKVLRQSSQGRYLVVGLYRNGKMKTVTVHRVVLLAFRGPCPAGQQGLHWDDDPTNNTLENLRYGSRGENARDCIRNGNHPKVNVTHCPQGHEYTPENTALDPKTGYRTCRPCYRARNNEAKRRRKARLSSF